MKSANSAYPSTTLVGLARTPALCKLEIVPEGEFMVPRTLRSSNKTSRASPTSPKLEAATPDGVAVLDGGLAVFDEMSVLNEVAASESVCVSGCVCFAFCLQASCGERSDDEGG